MTRLNIAFNSTAFASVHSVQIFAQKMGQNPFIEELDLSGLENLSQPEHLEEFCREMASNTSLLSLSLASVGLGDDGIHMLN